MAKTCEGPHIAVKLVKITVCQLHSSGEALQLDWARLMAHARSNATELVLLPEMPFYPWLALSPSFNPRSWQEAVDAHDRWERHFPEISPAALAATRPVDFGNGRNDEAFLWDGRHGVRSIHAKSKLENREGAWESAWYVSSPADFTPVEVATSVAAFLIGAELFDTGAGGQYARDGVTLLLVPRSTPEAESDRWLRAASDAARRGRCVLASSNCATGGGGWLIDPQGKLVASTNESQPFVTLDLAIPRSPQPTCTRNESHMFG
ncbi:MAG TPA: hypothetical protein VHW71_03120 [Steroidobacteraceae bacterium]|nr:hypothetical protein [Steroidobacteraceae bacterium]